MKTKASMMYGVLWLAGLLLATAGYGVEPVRVEIAGVGVDCFDVPVCVDIQVPASVAEAAKNGKLQVRLRQQGGGQVVVGQIELVGEQGRLWWVVPRLRARDRNLWEVQFERLPTGAQQGFSFRDKKDEYLDLLFAGRLVARYMYAYDPSSAQRRFETYKPFLHVYDRSGQLLTNGPDGERPYLAKQILYPHHRGIFIGWSRLGFGGRRYDLWHMKEAYQQHRRFEELSAGPVFGRIVAVIHWNDPQGRPMLVERRRMTIFRQSEPGLLLLEFETALRAVRGEVMLDGDPEHAGFQYRAANAVAAGGPEVKARYLFDREGIDPRKDRDLPWVAMEYGLGGRRYSVQHVNHPANPSPTVYSAYRDYGRFGAFFKKKIESGQELSLRYWIWVGEGSMPSREQLAGRYTAVVKRPSAKVLE